MLVCSGTMPTFEPLTTKQTNLALCSTIQTGFIDRRIAATRSSPGSSGLGSMLRGRPREPQDILQGPAPPGAAPPESPCARAQRRGRSGTRCLQSPSSSESPGATALCWLGAGAAEPRPSVWVLLSFGCP